MCANLLKSTWLKLGTNKYLFVYKRRNMSWKSKNAKGFTGARHRAAFPNVLCKPPLTDLRINKDGI